MMRQIVEQELVSVSGAGCGCGPKWSQYHRNGFAPGKKEAWKNKASCWSEEKKCRAIAHFRELAKDPSIKPVQRARINYKLGFLGG